MYFFLLNVPFLIVHTFWLAQEYTDVNINAVFKEQQWGVCFVTFSFEPHTYNYIVFETFKTNRSKVAFQNEVIV